MGCRSSAPLDVVDAREEFMFGTAGDRPRAASIEVLTLADLAALEDRRRLSQRGRRNHRNHDEHMSDIAALQQSLSIMETFFENLVGQTTGFYMEAMDPNNAQGSGPPPASDAAIASLIKSPLTEKERSLMHNKMCSVCCEAFVVNDLVSRLPCGHVYHPQCVEPWLNRHCTCPACRYELPTDDDDFEEGRMERMKSRKLLVCEDCDASSHSSESRPDVTWEDSSTMSWGWYEDYREDEAEEIESAPWIYQLIDEEMEDRPTFTLPAAMGRFNSGDVREENLDDGEPTPKASNESHNKKRFDGHEDDCIEEMVNATEEEECTVTTVHVE